MVLLSTGHPRARLCSIPGRESKAKTETHPEIRAPDRKTVALTAGKMTLC
jgi:hypothetical protein